MLVRLLPWYINPKHVTQLVKGSGVELTALLLDGSSVVSLVENRDVKPVIITNST